MRLEIHHRKIDVCVSGKNKQQLIEILLENDKDAAIGQPDEDALEMSYAAEIQKTMKHPTWMIPKSWATLLMTSKLYPDLNA